MWVDVSVTSVSGHFSANSAVVSGFVLSAAEAVTGSQHH